jgi:hypothetical protein
MAKILCMGGPLAGTFVEDEGKQELFAYEPITRPFVRSEAQLVMEPSAPIVRYRRATVGRDMAPHGLWRDVYVAEDLPITPELADNAIDILFGGGR